MAYGLGLFSRLAGAKEELVSVGIMGGSGVAGLAVASAVSKFLTEKEEGKEPLIPAEYQKFVPVLSLAGAVASVMFLRRYDSRVAVGAATGMAVHGLWHLINGFETTKGLVKQVPVLSQTGTALAGLGSAAFAPLPYMGVGRYLAGAPMTVSQVDSLAGAPMTISALNGGTGDANSLYN